MKTFRERGGARRSTDSSIRPTRGTGHSDWRRSKTDGENPVMLHPAPRQLGPASCTRVCTSDASRTRLKASTTQYNYNSSMRITDAYHRITAGLPPQIHKSRHLRKASFGPKIISMQLIHSSVTDVRCVTRRYPARRPPHAAQALDVFSRLV